MQIHKDFKKMITVSRIRPEDWQALKQVRLAALQDAPYAFLTRYEDAVKRSDEDWQQMAARDATGEWSSTCLVYREGTPLGMAGCFRKPEKPAEAILFAVWTAPEARGTEAGALLIDALCQWAQESTAEYIDAWVTEGNDRALRFYQKAGFASTSHPVETPFPTGSDEVLLRRYFSHEPPSG